jgi:hypothetical protein
VSPDALSGHGPHAFGELSRIELLDRTIQMEHDQAMSVEPNERNRVPAPSRRPWFQRRHEGERTVKIDRADRGWLIVDEGSGRKEAVGQGAGRAGVTDRHPVDIF